MDSRQGDRQGNRDSRQGDRQGSRDSRQSDRQDKQGDRQDDRGDRQEDRQDHADDAREDRQDFYDENRYGAGEFYDDRWKFAVGATVTAATFAALTCAAQSVYVDGVTYYNCGPTWYNRTYAGGGTSYVVVDAPPGY